MSKKKTAGGQKKNGNKNSTPEKIVLITAIVNLVTAILLLIEKLTS